MISNNLGDFKDSPSRSRSSNHSAVGIRARYPAFIQPPMTTNRQNKLGSSNLWSDGPSPWRQLRPMGTESQHGTPQWRWPHISSIIAHWNSRNMASTLLPCSLSLNLSCMGRSSDLTEQSGTMLLNGKTSYSPITMPLPTSMFSTSKSQQLPETTYMIHPKLPVGDAMSHHIAVKHVGGSMMEGAQTPRQRAIMCMSASSAEAMPTQHGNASLKPEVHQWANCPKYACNYIWHHDESFCTTLAMYTESIPALPSPLENQLNNSVALTTLCDNPKLFSLVSPIHIDQLEHYLSSHLNCPLVFSVVHSFHHGFWPYAHPQGIIWPLTIDNSFCPLNNPTQISFVYDQRDYKIQQGHFSPAFGKDLLPGMKAVLIGVIPKPHSEKLWLVVDQSSGLFSPNSFIPWEDVAVPLDDLHDLGVILQNVHMNFGIHTKLVLFKSDVSQAYCHVLIHPLWQLFQIIMIDGLWHVDRNNNFGNWGAGRLWGTFIGVVLWIAIHVKHIHDLLTYINDTFSWDFTNNILWYTPYNKFFPAKQTCLLQLWDELSIPHKCPKQLFGSWLTIIGFNIDTDTMTITMPAQAHTDLIAAMCFHKDWTEMSPAQVSKVSRMDELVT